MTIDQVPPFRSRVLQALLWSTASTWFTKALDFAVTLVLARLLTPADFGLVSLVTIYIALANVFVEGGFAQAIIQRAEIQNLHYDTAFWTSLGIGIVLTVATYLFGPAAFIYLFNESALGSVVQVTSILFTITALRSVQQAILTRRLQFKQLALRRAIGIIAGGAAAVSLALLGFGIWSLIALHVVSAAVGVIVLWTTSDWRPGLQFSFRCLKDLFAFGMHIAGRQLLAFANRRGLSFLIGYFMGVTALGYYVLASRIVMSALDLVTTSIQSVAFPAFSRLQNNPAKLRSALYQAVHFTSLLTFPMFLWLAATAALLIPFLLGAKWVPSATVLQVLCLVGVLNSVMRYPHSVMMACGKANWSLYIGMASTLGFIVGFFVVAERGIVAVAAAYVAVAYVLAPLALIAIHVLAGISYRTYLKQALPAGVASTAMLVVVVAAKGLVPANFPELVQLLLLVILGFLTYLGSLYLFDKSILSGIRELVLELKAQVSGRKA